MDVSLPSSVRLLDSSFVPPPSTSVLPLSFVPTGSSSQQKRLYSHTPIQKGSEPLPYTRRVPLVCESSFPIRVDSPLCARALTHLRRQPLLCPGAPSLYKETSPCVWEPPSLYTETAPSVWEPLPYTQRHPLMSGSRFPVRDDSPLCPGAPALHAATAARVRKPGPRLSLCFPMWFSIPLPLIVFACFPH